MPSAIRGKYDFDIGMYRPPSEGGSASLLLQITETHTPIAQALCIQTMMRIS